MAVGPNFCGVVLAAGESSRMGRDKALLPWPPGAATGAARGETFLSGLIRLLDPLMQMVVVVAGKNAKALGPIADELGAFLVLNTNPERGQFSSLQVGLQEVLNRGRDTAMVALVDRPPPRPETAKFLCKTFADVAAKGNWAVVPQYQGRHGHPIVIGREMISAFLQADPTGNARDVEHANQDRVHYIEVTDPFVTLNVDTAEDYTRLQQNYPGLTTKQTKGR